MQAIEFKNVIFSYRSGDGDQAEITEVLKNINFSVEKGRFIALLGKNGSGKSTLAKLLNGLLIPDFGEIVVDGFSSKNKEDLFEIKGW